MEGHGVGLCIVSHPRNEELFAEWEGVPNADNGKRGEAQGARGEA